MRVFVCVLVMVAGGWEVFAQSQPSDFFMEEFTFGLLGGLVGGPTRGTCVCERPSAAKRPNL
jgi:hypothetical protein